MASLLTGVSLAAAAPNPRVIICGGGVIGASTAYYLSKRGCNPTIIERCELAAAASGKAGGFLAADWNDDSPVGPLSRESFKLHAELSSELGAGKIDYRRLSCTAVALADGPTPPAPAKLRGVEWADMGAIGARPMGDETTIAQVHPRKLTLAMANAAESRGSTVRIGTVAEIEAGTPVRLRLADGEWLEADAVVLAMGPWTDQLKSKLQLPRMLGIKYHSVLMQAASELSQAVFFQGTQHAAYSTQHTALSTQHTARSTKHAAQSTQIVRERVHGRHSDCGRHTAEPDTAREADRQPCHRDHVFE
jgi:glycine/D-amino acid oxidase-like deaminating enzyme